MGTLIQNLFLKSSIKLKATEIPYIKHLDENIFRSGAIDEYTQKSTRGRGIQIAFSDTVTRQFFSSKHVASLYAHPNTVCYELNVKDIINLISLEGDTGEEFLEALWNATKNEIKDKNVIMNFFKCLGYFPKEFRENDDVITEYKKWANETIEDESYFNLNHTYPNVKTFNRISITKIDAKIFNSVLNHKYKNEKLLEIFKTCDGFYLPPMNCGFKNTINFITLFDTFHEEIFLKADCVSKLIQNNIKRYTFSDKYLNAFNIAGGRESERTYDEQCIYIVYFQDLYNRLVTNYIDTYINDIKGMLHRITKTSTEFDPFHNVHNISVYDLLTKIKMSTDKINNEINDSIFMCIYTSLEGVFQFNERHFINPPEKNPFGSEDVFLFTALRDVLISFVKEFDNLLEICNLSYFTPVVSGGFLFNLYSFGEYRRLTKDIDIKICEKHDKKFTTNEYEYIHTQLLCLIYIWENLLNDCLNHIGSNRIEFYIKKLLPSIPDLNEYNNKTYSFHIGTVNTINIVPEDFIDYEMQNPKRSSRYKAGDIFNKINTNLIAQGNYDIQTIKGKVKELLGRKRELKAKFNQEQLNEKSQEQLNEKTKRIKTRSHGGAGTKRKKITTNRTKTLKSINNNKSNNKSNNLPNANTLIYMHDIKEINTEIKNISKPITDFLTKNYSDLYEKFNEIKHIRNTRPYLTFSDDTQYKVGNFSSIYIKSSNNDEPYGLIDFTFNTKFSLYGSYSHPSKLKISYCVKYLSLQCVSYIDYIRETIKLNEICSSEYLIDEYNKCSPDLKKREGKMRKYRHRYDLISSLANEIYSSLDKHFKKSAKKNEMNNLTNKFMAMNIDSDSLEEILVKFENIIHNNDTDEQELSLWIINECDRKNSDSMTIG